MLLIWAYVLVYRVSSVRGYLILNAIVAPIIIVCISILCEYLLPAKEVVLVMRNILFILLYISLAILLRIVLNQRRRQ